MDDTKSFVPYLLLDRVNQKNFTPSSETGGFFLKPLRGHTVVENAGPDEERVVIKREEAEDASSDDTNSVYENLKEYAERSWKADLPDV